MTPPVQAATSRRSPGSGESKTTLPARSAPKTPADGVKAAEQELATKRSELEAAVAAGDVERVMTLRSFTVVNGPRAVTAAKVAVLDGEILRLQSAMESGELQRAAEEAEAVFAEARSALEQAQQALREADRVARAAQQADLAASRERTTAARRLGDLRTQRDQLATESEAEIAARIRAIAGLEPEPDEDTPQTPSRGSKSVGRYAPRPASVFSETDPRRSGAMLS